MSSYVSLDELVKVLKRNRVFGLNQALRENCRQIYLLDTYHNHLIRGGMDLKEARVYLFKSDTISKAAQLVNRHHRISVIGSHV